MLRGADPRFEFTDPPLRHSLRMVLAFAASAGQPAAVLTGPSAVAEAPPDPAGPSDPAETFGMVRVRVDGHQLTAAAALVWNRDLPRPLQQILFETAEGVSRLTAAISPAGPPH